MSDPAEIVKMIAEDFYGGDLNLSERCINSYDPWSQMPEVKAVEEIGVSEKPDRTVRLFLTLVSAMDRARDSNSLWKAAAKLFESNPEVFDPAKAVKIPLEDLKSLLSDNRVSQRHKQDSEAWHVISESLVSDDNPIRRVIDSGRGDAQELLEALKSRDDTGRPRFPLLRGPKIGPMWIRIMVSPGGAKIDNIEKVPVAVDVQVRRTTENLGIADTRGLSLGKAKPIIQAACHKAVSEVGIGGPSEIEGTSAALDPVLWFYGKYGCHYCEKSGKRVSIGRACDYCQL